MPVQDENVEAVRAARGALIGKYGGLRGWFRHLQQLVRKRRAPASRQGQPRKTGSTRK